MIRTSRQWIGEAPQYTQATPYTEALKQRRDQQAAMKIPRSQGAWDAEQNRLGSWHSGQGVVRPMMGAPIDNGMGPLKFTIDDERSR